MENLIIHQTDERMFYLSKMLNKKDFNNPTHIFAPNIVIEAHTLESIPSGATIYCGRCSDEAHALANSLDITIFNYSNSEKFQAINSRLTAEGTLMIMIEHSHKSVSDCNVLVLGFGRTGSACVRLFNALNISLDIATTSSIRPAHAFANNILPMRDFDFSRYDIVINTVPYPIVKDSQLMTMQKDSIYIDLASKPAINLEYAKYLGIDADIYPALPARVCPQSAAQAMYQYIMEVKNEG